MYSSVTKIGGDGIRPNCLNYTFNLFDMFHLLSNIVGHSEMHSSIERTNDCFFVFYPIYNTTNIKTTTTTIHYTAKNIFLFKTI